MAKMGQQNAPASASDADLPVKRVFEARVAGGVFGGWSSGF